MLIINKKEFDKRLQLAALNYSSLAAETGLAYSTISKIANGDRVPRAGTLRKITEALNCTPADILEEVPENE